MDCTRSSSLKLENVVLVETFDDSLNVPSLQPDHRVNVCPIEWCSHRSQIVSKKVQVGVVQPRSSSLGSPALRSRLICRRSAQRVRRRGSQSFLGFEGTLSRNWNHDHTRVRPQCRQPAIPQTPCMALSRSRAARAHASFYRSFR